MTPSETPETPTAPLSDWARRELATRERFLADTAQHELVVLRDEGVYRHLRVRRPGHSEFWYDVVTWPGNLVVTGDMGAWHFARVEDMFNFFGTAPGQEPRIKPDYWSSKMAGNGFGDDPARRFSYDTLRSSVLEWLDEVTEDWDDAGRREMLRAALDERVLGEGDWGGHPTEEEARRRLDDFEHDGLTMSDTGEWSLRDYTDSFLWNCWAIVYAVVRYDAHQASAARAAEAQAPAAATDLRSEIERVLAQEITTSEVGGGTLPPEYEIDGVDDAVERIMSLLASHQRATPADQEGASR